MNPEKATLTFLDLSLALSLSRLALPRSRRSEDGAAFVDEPGARGRRSEVVESNRPKEREKKGVLEAEKLILGLTASGASVFRVRQSLMTKIF